MGNQGKCEPKECQPLAQSALDVAQHLAAASKSMELLAHNLADLCTVVALKGEMLKTVQTKVQTITTDGHG